MDQLDEFHSLLFEKGQDVALRYITRDGRPGMTWACKLVQDSSQLLALFIPRGAPHKRWSREGPQATLADRSWGADTLRLMFPGRAHSVWLLWRPDGGFAGYYVKMEEPFRRTPIGFDTNDHSLDIVVAPDLTWSWKALDVLADQQRAGKFSAALTQQIQREGQNVVDAIERRLRATGLRATRRTLVAQWCHWHWLDLGR
jgi:hypothetical protein